MNSESIEPDRPYQGNNTLIVVGLSGFAPLLTLGLEALLARDPELTVTTGPISSITVPEKDRELSVHVAIIAAPCARDVRPVVTSLAHVAVVVLAASPTLAYESLVNEAGGVCLPRDGPPESILQAVQQLKAPLVQTQGSGVSLTPREHEVLVCILEGTPHEMTARQLGIGLRTVHTYASKLYRKFNVASRHELIRATRKNI